MSAVLILQTKGCLEAGLVVGIHYGKHGAAVKRAVRIEDYSACGIRNLLDANYNIHIISDSFSLVPNYFKRAPEMTILWTSEVPS